MRWHAADLDEEGLEGAAGLVVAEEAGRLQLLLALLHLRRRRDEVVEQHRHRDLRRAEASLWTSGPIVGETSCTSRSRCGDVAAATKLPLGAGHWQRTGSDLCAGSEPEHAARLKIRMVPFACV